MALPVIAITLLLLSSGLSKSSSQQTKPESDVFESLQQNACPVFFSDYSNLPNGSSISQANYVALLATFKIAFTSDYYIHQYKEPNSLIRSAGPQVNQELCLNHLRNLNKRLATLLEEKFESRDINLFRLLDTYGRIEPGRLMGHSFWPGHYAECLNLAIISPKFGKLKTRYCWALTRQLDWPVNEDKFNKIGVCLPESCDSADYEDKFKLIKPLIEFNEREVDKNSTEIMELYCLPDEDSPLRSNWLFYSPGTTIFVALLLAWLGFILTCTLRLELAKRKHGIDKAKNMERCKKWLQVSIVENLKRVFDLSSRTKASSGSYSVSLDNIDGTKALFMLPTLTATHSLLFANSTWDNHKDLYHKTSPLYVLLHVHTGFMTSFFMAITGLLTGYSLFKREERKPFMHNPFKWLDLIVIRYLRFIIVYGFAVGYAKYIGKFLFSGPYWDYGTNNAPVHYSSRALCEHESWWDTLLMTKNFVRPTEICMPVGWHLASDFQFLLVTPIFLCLLRYNENFGRKFILFTAGFLGLFSAIAAYRMNEGVDLRPIAGYQPDAFQLSLEHLMPIYTSSWHRINTYLIGLLFGHILFKYEQKRRRAAAKSDKSDKTLNLPYNMEHWTGKLFKMLSVVYLLSPYIARRLTLSVWEARFMVAAFMPIAFLISTLVGILPTFLCATGFGPGWLVKLLNFPLWKPVARMILCVTVVQFETIPAFHQISQDTQSVTDLYLFVLYSSNLVVVLVVAFFVHVLIEEPGRRLAEYYWAKVLSSVEEFWHLPKIGNQIRVIS